MIVWRDDDVGCAHINRAGIAIPGTKLADLLAVDDMLRRHGKAHTIAVIACGLAGNRELVELIRAREMVVQLHCWKHDDLTANAQARTDLERAADAIFELFDARPTVLYPPWNRSSREVEEAAAALGMTVSHRKVSLDQYVRAGGDVDVPTVNFHHWHVPDVILLDRALSLPEAR